MKKTLFTILLTLAVFSCFGETISLHTLKREYTTYLPRDVEVRLWPLTFDRITFSYDEQSIDTVTVKGPGIGEQSYVVFWAGGKQLTEHTRSKFVEDVWEEQTLTDIIPAILSADGMRLVMKVNEEDLTKTTVYHVEKGILVIDDVDLENRP